VGIAQVCKHGRGVRSDVHKVDRYVVRLHSLVSPILLFLDTAMRIVERDESKG
jgi:hypothetical protein